MDRDAEALEIYQRNINKEEKIRLLEDLALDITNEMEAQDQNMHPEMYNRLSDGLMMAKNFIRKLKQ